MTLVIAGYYTDENDYRNPKLFVAADSAITNGNQTLLTGFDKIKILPINVFTPTFTGNYFKGYFTAHLISNCFIAFAGSTLIATDVISSISSHLNNLLYGYEGSGACLPGRYQILMQCEKNSLENQTTFWDEDMFLDKDIDCLLTGDLIAKVVLHSIKTTLNKAKLHKIDKSGWNSLLAEYVVGSYCQVKKCNRLFKFKPNLINDSSTSQVDIQVDFEEIQEYELVILGMHEVYKDAKEVYDNSLKEKKDTRITMFKFLNSMIDKIQNDGRNEIAYPSVLKTFDQGKLEDLYVNK